MPRDPHRDVSQCSGLFWGSKLCFGAGSPSLLSSEWREVRALPHSSMHLRLRRTRALRGVECIHVLRPPVGCVWDAADATLPHRCRQGVSGDPLPVPRRRAPGPNRIRGSSAAHHTTCRCVHLRFVLHSARQSGRCDPTQKLGRVFDVRGSNRRCFWAPNWGHSQPPSRVQTCLGPPPVCEGELSLRVCIPQSAPHRRRGRGSARDGVVVSWAGHPSLAWTAS